MLLQSCCFAFEIYFFLDVLVAVASLDLKVPTNINKVKGSARDNKKEEFSSFPSLLALPLVLRETTGNELLFCLQWWKMMSNERRPNTWQFIPPANQTSSMFPLMTIRTGNLPLYSIKSRVNNCIARWGLGEWKGLKKTLEF